MPDMRVTLDGPYPVWMHLEMDGKKVATFHHARIRELYQALELAMRDAKVMLKDKADEV